MRHRTATQIRHLRRRSASVPDLDLAAYLGRTADALHLRALRLSGQAVHGIRAARAYRLSGRRRRGETRPRAVAVRAALHRARRELAFLPGRGHGFRLLSHEYYRLVSAERTHAVRAQLVG